MADFQCRQFEIGLEFVRCSFAECNNFSKVSSELKKDAQVIWVREAAAPRVFKLELLVSVARMVKSQMSRLISLITATAVR